MAGHQARPVRVPEPGGVGVRVSEEEEAGPASDPLHLRPALHLRQQSPR
jgi:hypothetical protein